MNNPSLRHHLAVLLGGASLVASTAAFGATQCKGLEKTPCAAKTTCHWIDSYTTKNGNKVDGYCRSSAKKAPPADAEKPTPTRTSANTSKPPAK